MKKWKYTIQNYQISEEKFRTILMQHCEHWPVPTDSLLLLNILPIELNGWELIPFSSLFPHLASLKTLMDIKKLIKREIKSENMKEKEIS